MISNLIDSDWIEPAAVVLAIAYLLLAANQQLMFCLMANNR